MAFPINRMRRLRASENLRSMVRETQLDVKDFIYPLFVTFGKDKQNPDLIYAGRISILG